MRRVRFELRLRAAPKLQELRGMIDPTTGVGKFTSIQIKLKPGVDADAVRDKLAGCVRRRSCTRVSTWQDKQGRCWPAVQMETAVLNVLLFLIIAVAGFGILAIFFMIVVEKTRDIGILKSLGASGRGIMGIFLGYGLCLGIVGAGVGHGAGRCCSSRYINEIADCWAQFTGKPVFDPSIYLLRQDSDDRRAVDGRLDRRRRDGIAVLASVLPARRAARLHPVEALRYE